MTSPAKSQAQPSSRDVDATQMQVPGRSAIGAPGPAPVTGEIPSLDANATPSCPLCGRGFHPGRVGQNYCSRGCRKQAWRRRKQTPLVPVLVPAKGRSRREVTVYECGSCGVRAVGNQRCDDCGTWMGRVGLGGLCPHCDGPVAVSDLLDTDAMAPPVASAGRETLTTQRRPTVSVPARRSDTTKGKQP
jgi:hypothetical protein